MMIQHPFLMNLSSSYNEFCEVIMNVFLACLFAIPQNKASIDLCVEFRIFSCCFYQLRIAIVHIPVHVDWEL